ncbi:MAG TPA: hypothetical protein GX736_05185 [Mogibacterium sp.]|nr:hypothetical protein [Mogibacterium sp.]
MKKNFNRRIAFIIAVLLIVFSIALIACNKKTEENTSDNEITQTEVSDKTDSEPDKKENPSNVEVKDEEIIASNESTASKKPEKKDPSKKGKTWVPPVYKTVHHKEEGHYETKLLYVICTPGKCGKRFSTEAAWYKHWQDYMASNGGVCDHMHDNPRKVTEQVYVVDKPAYTEKVLVKKGYWK